MQGKKDAQLPEGEGANAPDLQAFSGLSFGVLVQIAGRAAASELDIHARKAGLSSGQLSLLGMIQRKPGLLLLEYASILQINDATLSRYAEKLVEGGYVQREKSELDARRILMSVTSKGEELVLGLRGDLKNTSDRYRELMGAREMKALEAELERFLLLTTKPRMP